MRIGKIGPALTAVIAIVAGLMLMVFPTASAQTLSYAAGGVFAGWGAIMIALYFIRQSGNPDGFANGLFFVALGLFMVLRPELIGAIVPYILGFVMLMGCFRQLQEALRMRRGQSKNAATAAILGGVETVWAVLLIAQAFGTSKAAYILQGAGFIAMAAIDMVTRIWLGKPEKP